MYRLLAAALTVMALWAGPALSAGPSCKEEVRTAFIKQRSSRAFSMVAELNGESGPAKITVEYLPPDRMRMHVCWGSTMAPHHTDVEIKDIIDIVLSGRPHAVSFPAANARHEHEWKVWRDVKLPAGKKIIPGVIDSTTNVVEHPEVVADRILNFASVVGRGNVMAGVDCGFGTFAGRLQVDSKIVWMKLASLAQGARLASKELW